MTHAKTGKLGVVETVDGHCNSCCMDVSPEAGLGADDEAAAVLVEVGELELGTRRVVVRGHVHGVAVILHLWTFVTSHLFALLDVDFTSLHFLRT